MAIYGRIELSANGKITEDENIEKDKIESESENNARTKIVNGCNKFVNYIQIKNIAICLFADL